MNQRDKHKSIAEGVESRKNKTQKELADLLVKFSERMEEDGFNWNKRVHRLVGEYQMLVDICNIPKQYPDNVPEVKD